MTSEIYVENGVGKAVLEALNLFKEKHHIDAVWQNDVHPEMQRTQFGDEWWIRDIAGRGMAILTQDRAILDDPDERRAVIESSAKIIALGKADYSTWDKLRCIMRHWDEVDALLRAPGPQAVTLWLSSFRIETF